MPDRARTASLQRTPVTRYVNPAAREQAYPNPAAGLAARYRQWLADGAQRSGMDPLELGDAANECLPSRCEGAGGRLPHDQHRDQLCVCWLSPADAAVKRARHMNDSEDLMSQHMDALAVAQERRLARARLRREVAALPNAEGFMRLARLVDEQPPEVRTLPVLELLGWPRQFGPTLAVTTLRGINRAQPHWRIGESNTVGSLTDRQRRTLVGGLRVKARTLASNRLAA